MAINIMTAFEREPKPLNFIWPTFLSGTVGALIGQGSAGKSMFALEAAMAVACGDHQLGDLLGIQPNGQGPVVYLAGEDPEPPLEHRIHAIGKHLSIDAKRAIADNLTVQTIIGEGIDVLKRSYSLTEYCVNTRLLIIDTLIRVHHENENDNGAMAQVIAILEALAHTHGTTILYLHHVNKGSAKENTNDQSAARGASALTDNARWCANLTKMTEAQAKNNGVSETQRGYYVQFKITKANYDVIPPSKWYKRSNGGVLLPVDLNRDEEQNENDRVIKF